MEVHGTGGNVLRFRSNLESIDVPLDTVREPPQLIDMIVGDGRPTTQRGEGGVTGAEHLVRVDVRLDRGRQVAKELEIDLVVERLVAVLQPVEKAAADAAGW